MKSVVIITAALTISGCADRSVSICTGADLRRTGYSATIAVADAWTATGRPVPSEVLLARIGAVAALSVLNARCPIVPANTQALATHDDHFART